MSVSSVLKKSVFPSLVAASIAAGGVWKYKDYQNQQIVKVFSQQMTELEKENRAYYQKIFNKRLVDEDITIYSELGNIKPKSNQELSEDCLKHFIKYMNRKQELLVWLYSAEYEQFKARQVLPQQDLLPKTSRKNDFYTLNVHYNSGEKDIREDIIALLAEENFKMIVREHYTHINFHELFALARTICSNIQQALNSYHYEDRILLMRAIVEHRIKSAEKTILGQDHALAVVMGKDNIFSSLQGIVDFYLARTVKENRILFQFRDNDFASYRGPETTTLQSIQNLIDQAAEDQRPSTLLIGNHGGVQHDSSGYIILNSQGMRLTAQNILPLIQGEKNYGSKVSSIQFFNCYANNTISPLIRALDTLVIDDAQLPVLISLSEEGETAFLGEGYHTPYRNLLDLSQLTLTLQHYYTAQIQPLGYNASCFVPARLGMSTSNRQRIRSMMKYTYYIQQY